MQKIPTSKPLKSTPLVIAVGATVGFSIVGDSLMYNILALEANNLGIALPLVGILLSANRLIRLGSNSWAGMLFERFGPRLPFLAATFLGLISTILYGVGWGFTLFLLARVLWGIAWSALRQGGYQAVWTGPVSAKGRLMGLLWGLVRLGSALSVLIGGYLYDQYGYPTAIAVIIGITILAVPTALSIRWPDEAKPEKGQDDRITGVVQEPGQSVRRWQKWIAILDSSEKRWLIGAGFLTYLLHSIIVATTSLFLSTRLGEQTTLLALGIGAATVTGLLLAARWLIDLLLGPWLGYLSDQFGQAQTAVVLACLQLLGLVAAVSLPSLWAIASFLLVFLCDGGLSVVLNAASSGIATQTTRPHIYVGIFTTATDAGAAIGPLTAFSMAAAVGFPFLYLTVGLMSTLVLLRFRWLTTTTNIYRQSH